MLVGRTIDISSARLHILYFFILHCSEIVLVAFYNKSHETFEEICRVLFNFIAMMLDIFTGEWHLVLN